MLNGSLQLKTSCDQFRFQFQFLLQPSTDLGRVISASYSNVFCILCRCDQISYLSQLLLKLLNNLLFFAKLIRIKQYTYSSFPCFSSQMRVDCFAWLCHKRMALQKRHSNCTSNILSCTAITLLQKRTSCKQITDPGQRCGVAFLQWRLFIEVQRRVHVVTKTQHVFKLS